MTGTFKVDGSGNVELKEDDGIDYAPVTVQVTPRVTPGLRPARGAPRASRPWPPPVHAG